MNLINKIVLDYEPRKKILPRIPSVPNEPEMSEFESAFLCGLLRKYKPTKILEIGVAAGGTTSVILQCLEDIKHESETENYLGGGAVPLSNAFDRNIDALCLG